MGASARFVSVSREVLYYFGFCFDIFDRLYFRCVGYGDSEERDKTAFGVSAWLFFLSWLRSFLLFSPKKTRQSIYHTPYFWWSVFTILFWENEVSFILRIYLLLLGIDLAAQGYKVMPTVDNGFYQAQPKLLADIKIENEYFRVYTGKIHSQKFKGFPNEPNIEGGYYAAREHLYPYYGMIFGVEYPNGILGIGLELKSPWVWNEWFERSSPAQRIRILERSNVKYWVDGDRLTMFSEGRPVILRTG